MKKNILLLFFLCLGTWAVHAQSAHKLLREGNDDYEQKNFEGAAENYYKALEKDPSNLKGKFNLGNATYKNEGYDEAIKHYSSAVDLATDQETKSNAYYNLGNAYFKKQEMEKSVESYKNSLRLNPNDVSTKKNLALAQRVIQQQQQQQQQQDENQDQDNQDKSEEKNEDQQQQDQQQSQEGQGEPKEEQPQDGEQQEQKDLNKKEAEELLKIMDEEERKVQEKLRKGKSSNKKPEKDW